MASSTTDLVLAPDAFIDLQVHTTYSDGTWSPEQLLDHLVGDQFGLVAITDHDRADTGGVLQQLAVSKGMPVLVAVEMSSMWRGDLLDLLCFGFDPDNNQPLQALADDVLRRQQENTRKVYAYLLENGFTFPSPDSDHPDAPLIEILDKPCVKQPHALVDLMKQHGYGTPERSAGRILMDGGLSFETNDPAAIVHAAHQSGGICVIAHPGRDDGFVTFDEQKLDELREQAPVDGIEVYYPLHTPEQVALFQSYAQKHNLLISAGSDSHKPEKPPIKYRAELTRDLLERVGIQVR